MTCLSSRCLNAVARVGRSAPIVAGLVAALLLAPGPAAAYTKTFSAGSLIIPGQMEYQEDCGMTSAYGLIYTILMANTQRVKDGKKPITIYWVIEPKKLSHHRCDTDTDALPDYSKENDNDGCDLAIQSAVVGQPVALLNVNNGEDAPFNVYSSSYNTTKGESSRTSSTPKTEVGPAKKVMKYSGGLWVIDAVDRAATLDLMKNDTYVNKFRDGGNCVNIPVATNGSHHTVVHSAKISFTAPIARMMNVKPPLIALLDAGAVTILQTYLKNAGLGSIPGAGGTTTTHGIIYDTLDPVMDFVSTPTYPYGALNMADPADASRTFYQVVWAPHWVADGQSTLPADGSPGDAATGDKVWTHYDSSTNTYDDPITNALKNIGRFADVGNGVFAECASIESFEGSYGTTGAACSGTYACMCTNEAQCTLGASEPLPACAAGATFACGYCYTCPAGSTLDASVCGEVKCVDTAAPCPTGYDYSCGTCNACEAGWTLVTSKCPSTPATCVSGKNKVTPNTVPLNTVPFTTAYNPCVSNGYTATCPAAASSIDIEGNPSTRFHVTNRLNKNGLGNSFAGPDCTDAKVTGTKYKYPGALTGDCFDFHPDTGGPANIFSQKGNFNYTGTSGHIHQYQPPSNVGSFYKPGVLQFATSRNQSASSRDGWDFTSARHKDNDPEKGMVVYLAGHSYQNDVAGNRIVLNTMLNLGFSDEGPEISRSEPVGYVDRTYDATTGLEISNEALVFQGTYMQRMPPGPFQDWLTYNPAAPHSWKFPYIDGHLRAYKLSDIALSKQDFTTKAKWDAASLIPAPGNRTLHTALSGAANLGWKKVALKYTETDQATCTNSDGNKDALGKPLCDLSEALAVCDTAGVTLASLKAGDPGEVMAKRLGAFVQRVRGYCYAHNSSTGEVYFEPTEAQCDNQKDKYKNKPRLGGIDHSSPAVVGPSGHIWDETLPDKSVIKWSKRPTVAYAGGRDGMLHAFFVSAADTAWKAEGVALPSSVVPGQELWAFVPPGQLCGLATNGAMVDSTVNVIDLFGNFPKDANHDGVFDLTDATERPDGIREWRTVLLVAAGEGGGEVFALDVTNPLLPVMLWHLDGAKQKADDWDMDGNGLFGGVDDHMDKTKAATYALKWFDWDDDAVATTHIPTDFETTDKTVLSNIKTGKYDYRNLGIALGTTIGLHKEGDAFRYIAYLTTNAADWTDPTPLGFKGIEFFAIDMITGEKLWQWERRYQIKTTDGSIIADNAIPGRPALVDVDNDGSVDRVYAGDIEGHLWELAAEDGRNLNYLVGDDGKKHSFPLFGTPSMLGTGADTAITDLYKPSGSSGLTQQPLTTPIGIGRISKVPLDLTQYLAYRIAVAQGTMGVDWPIAPYEKGHVYVLPVHPETGTRLIPPIDTKATPAPLLYGLLKKEADWDIELAVGERVFGMPKIVGDAIYINTSYGAFTGDISETLLDAGATYKVTATGAKEEMAAGKAFGGVLVIGTDLVISSASGLQRKTNEASPPDAMSPEGRARNRTSPAIFDSWEQRGDDAPVYLNPDLAP